MPMMDRGNVILVWFVVQERQRKGEKNILWLSSRTIVLFEDIPQRFAVGVYNFAKTKLLLTKLNKTKQNQPG